MATTPGPRDDVRLIAPGGPSHAERARTIVASGTFGSLSTLARRPAGYPFGSLVEYALDDTGSPLLVLSDLAEHSKNLAGDPRASLLVTENPPDGGDPVSAGRVTLVGDVTQVTDEAELAAARQRYQDVHPQAFWAGFADFHAYRMKVESVRYVGGFGRMSTVRAEQYLGAEPDPLREHVGDICGHMNDDHSDALLTYVRVLGGEPEATGARMTSVDRHGFDVSAVTAEGAKPVRIDFTKDVTTPDHVRQELIRLVRQARTSTAEPHA